MKKSQISFANLLGATCGESHTWLKRNRSKGIRWLIKNLYRHGQKWMQKHDAWIHLSVAVEHDVFINNSNFNIWNAAKEMSGASKRLTAEMAIAILDKYEISDKFRD